MIARRIVPLLAVLATGCAGTMNDGRPDVAWGKKGSTYQEFRLVQDQCRKHTDKYLEDNWGGAFDNDPMPGFHSSTEQGIWLREDAKQEFYKCLRSKRLSRGKGEAALNPAAPSWREV